MLVNLSKGLLGEMDSRLLGMLILGKIFGAATQRAAEPGNNRKPFNLFIDEAHNFTTDTMVQMLAEGRKFGLNLVLANQNLTQLDTHDSSTNVMQAVLGNVGTLLSFRLGIPDAQKLELYFKPQILASDLTNLPNYMAAAHLMVNNRPAPPFVVETLPATPNINDITDQKTKEMIIEEMRKRYTHPISEIESSLIKRRKLSYEKRS